MCSFDNFKSAFLNLQEPDFFAWHDKFVQYRQVVGEMKDSTLECYDSQRNKLKQFKQEILMTDITSDFVHKYNDFLAERIPRRFWGRLLRRRSGGCGNKPINLSFLLGRNRKYNNLYFWYNHLKRKAA